MVLSLSAPAMSLVPFCRYVYAEMHLLMSSWLREKSFETPEQGARAQRV